MRVKNCLDIPQSCDTIAVGKESCILTAVAEVVNCHSVSDGASFGVQLATASQYWIFRHPPCAGDWSMGDICLDHDELGWSASCSFESFEVYMREGPCTYTWASGRSQQRKYRR